MSTQAGTQTSTHARTLSLARSIAGLIAALLVSFAAAGIGGLATAGDTGFYQELTRPSFAPPAWLFAPVWNVLYTLMGVAAWLVWKRTVTAPLGTPAHAAGRRALAAFAVHLVLNALWSWVFFAWRELAWALAEIVALWMAIALITLLFWRVRPLAGWLMLPYLAWVGFAAVLNAALWRLNPGV